MNRKILLFLLLNCLNQAYSQSVPFDKAAFHANETGLKEAVQNLNKGSKLMDQSEGTYRLALPFLEKAQDFNPKNALLNLRIGLCLLKTSRQYESLSYFQTAKTLDPSIDPKLEYYIGYGNHLNSNWAEAIKSYTLYSQKLTRDEKNERIEVSQRIFECENGKKLSIDSVNVEIVNLGKVNSSHGDYIPLLSADGKMLFFTSRRPETLGGGIDDYDGEFFEDVYFASKDSAEWRVPKNLGAPINNEGHDAAVGLSVDGHSLIIFRGDVNGGDLFLTTNNGYNWTNPVSLGVNVNSEFHESSACFSPNGRTLYFVSDREGGFGGRDIYKSNFDTDKKIWMKAENLGPVVNTINDEEGVFMHPDGKTLYFSSKGHNTIGGYDIFYSDWDGTKWSQPVNLGIPINTPGDEVFFQVSADGRTAYYSSYRLGGVGEKDLYRIDYLERTEPVTKMILLKGKVVDAETGLPIAAEIEVIDLDLNQTVGKFNNDTKTGEYLISLPAGKNYGTVITSKGYLFESENFDLLDPKGYKEVTKNVEMKPIKPGNGIVLHNIFFETGIYTLKETSKNELVRIIDLMKIYPSLKVEIQGNTDNVGGEAFNIDLSQKRANVVKDYLTVRGIDATRLVAVGNGYSKPRATNDTPEGKALNRRIEMVVIAN